MNALPARLALFCTLVFAGVASAAEITFWEGPGFRGRTYSSTQTIANFADIGFNDRASSVVVRSGSWQLCSDAYFRGRCVTLAAGKYPSLSSMGLENAVSSVRDLGGWSGGGGGGGRGPRAVLYEGPGMSGRSFAFGNQVMANLEGTGFNDRASSLRIEGGYFIFCTDANFGGECKTFGPGDYPSLPPGMNNRISSGRRINESYPYNTSPNWSAPPQAPIETWSGGR